MSDFQAMKDRAIKRAMRGGAAGYIELLIKQIQQIVPDGMTFTKSDVIDLLTGMAEGMRNEP